MVDNRQIGEGCRPNNSVLVTCDHATNDLKMLATSDQEKPLTLSNDAFDPGAADFASTFGLSHALKMAPL